MTLSDQSSRLAAVDPTRSFIVQAPAGSGKTSLLVERFINLIKNCAEPEECLAITFTKKAALEMRQRVLATLQSLVATQQYSLNHIYSRILLNPHKLQILTIDSFEAQLVEKTPLLSKLGVNYKVAADPESLYRKAIANLLGRLDHTSLIESEDLVAEKNNLIKLYKYFGNNHKLVIDLLVELLQKREQWLPLIIPIKLSHQDDFIKSINFEHVRIILEQNLKNEVNNILVNVAKYLPDLVIQKKILELANYAATNISESTHPLISLRHVESWLPANYAYRSFWEGIAYLLLNQDGAVRKVVNYKQGFVSSAMLKNPLAKKLAKEAKVEMHELLQLLSENHQNFCKQLLQLKILPATTYDEDSWGFLATLFGLLPLLVAHLMLIFEEALQVDFTQISLAALQALKGEDDNPTDLALILDSKLKHILVDEFQDTSILHYKLIEQLVAMWEPNDGRTIFIVGDPMQSIYRFRQADVGLFLQVQSQGIANFKLNKLYLNTNFRANDAMVKDLNDLFSKIFPSENNIISGGIKYNCSSRCNFITEHHKNNKIESNLYNLTSEAQFVITKDQTHETNEIIKLIQQLKHHDPKLQIAILFRSRLHSINIINKLRLHNITYQSNELELLANKTIIMDLYMLLRVILHLNDVIAWLGLLRGPLVGVDLRDLNILFEIKPNSVLGCLQSYKNNSKLSQEAIHRLNYVMPILMHAISLREKLNLAVLIKKTWLDLGGDLLATPVDLKFAEEFFLILSKQQDVTDCSKIKKLMHNLTSTINSEEIDVSAVQLMTIHKAKGLEFDVVILPGIERSVKVSKNQMLLWDERAFCLEQSDLITPTLLEKYLLCAPIKAVTKKSHNIYDYIKMLLEDKDLHEAKRLLYVAMSRAKKKFYGFASGKKYAAKSFFSFLRSYLTNDNLIDLSEDLDLISHNILPKNDDPLFLYRLPISWYLKGKVKDQVLD